MKKSLAVFLLPIGILARRSLFRDEALYVYLAKRLLENPREVYPYVPIYVPHPPGLRYRLAIGLALGISPRVRSFSLSLLALLALTRANPDSSAGSAAGIAFYSAVVFDDAPGGLLAALAAEATLAKRYTLAAAAFLAASFVRFQSVLVSAAYSRLLGLRRREPRDFLASLFALPGILSRLFLYSGPVAPPPAGLAESLALYAILFFSPAAFLLARPLLERESLRMVASAYFVNALTRSPYDRYYLAAVAFASGRLNYRGRYPAYASVATFLLGLRTALKIPRLRAIVPASAVVAALDPEDAFVLANRLAALYMSVYAYSFALPHPCMRSYYFD